MPDNPTADFLRLYFCRTRWKVASCLNIGQHVACLVVWIYEGQTILSISVRKLCRCDYLSNITREGDTGDDAQRESTSLSVIMLLYNSSVYSGHMIMIVCLFNCFLPPLRQTISELVETDCYQKISGFQCCQYSFPVRHPWLLLQPEEENFLQKLRLTELFHLLHATAAKRASRWSDTSVNTVNYTTQRALLYSFTYSVSIMQSVRVS